MEKTPKYKHGFKMPENYLETFESRLQTVLKVELENKPKTEKQTIDSKVISLLKPLYISIAVAACLAIYITINNTQNALSLDEIACSMSHLSVYKKIVKNSIAEAIIFEDDIIINSKLIEIVNKIPKNVELVNFKSDAKQKKLNLIAHELINFL
mgnify:CR=1 FL=1